MKASPFNRLSEFRDSDRYPNVMLYAIAERHQQAFDRDQGHLLSDSQRQDYDNAVQVLIEREA
jgi:hypothetical protein